MRTTIAMHIRYILFVHVSTVLCKTMTNSWNFHLKLNAGVMCLVSVSFETNRHNEQIQTIKKFEGKTWIDFCTKRHSRGSPSSQLNLPIYRMRIRHRSLKLEQIYARGVFIGKGHLLCTTDLTQTLEKVLQNSAVFMKTLVFSYMDAY